MRLGLEYNKTQALLLKMYAVPGGSFEHLHNRLHLRSNCPAGKARANRVWILLLLPAKQINSSKDEIV